LPRGARIKDIYGIYHIQQQGSAERPLFQNDCDRDKFLEILNHTKEKNGYKIYGYCLASQNEYHLLINANGSDISKIMKSINISYAMYLDHHSSVYKDRYKSKLVKDKEELFNILNNVHATGKKLDTIYNSYCVYIEDNLSFIDILDKTDIEYLSIDDSFKLINKCKDCIKTVDEAFLRLNEIGKSKKLSIAELLDDKTTRNDLIKEFRKGSTLSLKELGILFGGLSESSICKILKN